jgi:hypothetical protein
MKRQLWRLQDLRDGGGLGYMIELFFLSLRQLLSIPSSHESNSAFYTGTFKTITSHWEESKAYNPYPNTIEAMIVIDPCALVFLLAQKRQGRDAPLPPRCSCADVRAQLVPLSEKTCLETRACCTVHTRTRVILFFTCVKTIISKLFAHVKAILTPLNETARPEQAAKTTTRVHVEYTCQSKLFALP